MTVSEIKQVAAQEPKALAIQSWDDLTRRAEYLAKSQLIPVALRGKPNDVAVILQHGMELGIQPLQALNGIDVIQGTPTVSPELTLALIYSKIRAPYVKIDVDESKQEAIVTMARDESKMDQSYTARWDMKKAATMGLASKDNWKKQPTTMLRWRAIGEAARVIFPDVTKGFYITGELEEGEISNRGDNGKAQSLEDKLMGKPETKEVVAEVIQPEPERPHEEPKLQSIGEIIKPKVEPVQPEILTDLGEYVIPEGKLRGVKLKDVPNSALLKCMQQAQSHCEKMLQGGQQAPKPIMEMIARIEAYLQQYAEPGSFEAF